MYISFGDVSVPTDTVERPASGGIVAHTLYIIRMLSCIERVCSRWLIPELDEDRL